MSKVVYDIEDIWFKNMAKLHGVKESDLEKYDRDKIKNITDDPSLLGIEVVRGKENG